MNKKITKKDNVIDFPNKLSSIEKEIEAIVFACLLYTSDAADE